LAKSLRIATWNSNGLHNLVQEISLFLTTNKIDILLISESHSTEQTVINLACYTLYYAHHPHGTVNAGSSTIIKTTLKHFVLEPYSTNKIQSTIIITTTPRTITIAAIYSPPRHVICSEEYEDFLLHLGPHFLVAGDWNAKHTARGSRLTTPKARNLLHVIQHNNLNYLSTGEPTYWPADPKKTPDLLDFAITNVISGIYSNIESSLDLESDHSPIIITLSTSPIWKTQPPRLCNKYTNRKQFQDYINKNITLNIKLKNTELADAVQHLTTLIQEAAWISTPERKKTIQETNNIPLHIKELVHEKCSARRRWQNTRSPLDKTRLNRLTHNLRSDIRQARNDSFQLYTASLTPDDHSLWKTTKKIQTTNNGHTTSQETRLQLGTLKYGKKQTTSHSILQKSSHHIPETTTMTKLKPA